MRQQYHFRQQAGQLLIWDINALIKRTQGLPVIDVSLSSIRELDERYWYDLGGATPTCRNIVEHTRLIMAADLAYPVILCHKGRVLDGMHRICKAQLQGKTTISAIRFETAIPPDFVDIGPEDLPY